MTEQQRLNVLTVFGAVPRFHNRYKIANNWALNYNDIMGAIAFQTTSLTIVYSVVYSGADQRKHQSSASLAFVRGIHRWPVNSPQKWPVTRKMFSFDDVIMDYFLWLLWSTCGTDRSYHYIREGTLNSENADDNSNVKDINIYSICNSFSNVSFDI